MAMVEAEGAFGKVLEGMVGEENELGYSSFGYGIDRLELLGYCVHGRTVSDDITGRFAISAAPQLVAGAVSDGAPVGGVLGNSDARRQWVSMFAIHSPDDLSAVRQEHSRYDSGCDFQCMPISESPTTSLSTDMVSQCPGGIWVWNYVRREDVAISCARRQGLPATALHPLVDCYVIRQELMRYHSGYDFARLPNSESPTIVLSPETFLECPGGISV